MKTINIGIFAHVDAGKTTITEQMLYKTGKTRILGKVDDGTSVSDKMKIERERGISVKSSCVSIEKNDTKINIIDTPGHVDFAGEIERCLCALDAAVLVISSVEGIQSHTRIIWKALTKLNIPTLFVINKIDRAGSDYRKVLQTIRDEFSKNVFLFNDCKNEGKDNVTFETFFSGDSEKIEEMLLAMDDNDIIDRYLDRTLGKENIVNLFNDNSKKRNCFGAVLICAKNGLEIDFLIDKILDCLPDSSIFCNDKTSGVVFKIEHDKTMGVCAYIRMFSGEIKNRDTVYSSGRETGKASQIRISDGGKFVDCGVLKAGEIGIVFGLSDIKCGDTVGEDIFNRHYNVSAALMMVSVSPKKEEDKTGLMKALAELNREDPLLNFEFSCVTGEMYISITGVIQLEILKEIIAEKYDIEVDFSEPNVIFKETPKITATGFESYTMPKPCWAKVELQIEPLPRGSGVKYKSVIKDNIMPYRYQNHVELSVIRDCIKQGIFGWEVCDAEITLIGGEYHSIHTHPLDFFVATPVAFLRALQNCQTILLEPFIKVTMSVSEEHIGTIIGNVIEMRGEFDSPVINNDKATLIAYLPVQESIFYPSKFSSITSGQGTYFSEFYEYRECPKELYKSLPRIGVNPLDRAKWILYCRSAMGNN